MPLTREQMLRNLAKARAARKRNLKMRRNPSLDSFSSEDVKDLTEKQRKSLISSIVKKGKSPVKEGPKPPRKEGPVKKRLTRGELRSELKGMAKASRERLSNLSPVQKELISKLGTLDSNVKSLLKKGRTSGALTAALKRAIAIRKKLSKVRFSKIKTRRPDPEGKAIPMKSYTVRFYVASGAGDVQHVGNDLHYFTVRAAATDAKSIVRAAVGKGSPIYEGGYEGWLSDDESTNKALETAKALGVSFGGGGKTLPISEAPASVIEAVEPAIDENADEAFKSNPGEKKSVKKVYVAPKIRQFKDKDKTILTKSYKGIGARWENVLQTNEVPKMFLHPKLYVSQKSDGMAILAVISEDAENRRPAQVESLSVAATPKKITPKRPQRRKKTAQ